MAQEKTAASRPRRRWLQFKLRTLLVAMVAACIPLAWLTMKLERTRRQRRAVVAIDNVGGNVWYIGTPKAVPPAVGVIGGGHRTLRHNVIPYDSQQRSGNLLAQVVEEATAGDVVAVDFDRRETLVFMQQRAATFGIRINGQEIENDSADKWILHRRLDRYGRAVPPDSAASFDWRDFQMLPALELLNLGDLPMDDDDLREIGKLANLRCLLIGNVRDVTDAGLESLSSLTKLRVLSLNGSRITDDGLRHLSALTRLEVLELDHAPIRGPGLVHLRPLRRLKLLSLRFSPLEDQGLVHLAGLTALERLYFFDTRLTDTGLAHLRPLTELRILHLGKTGVTFAGASAFEQDLPRSPIVR